MIRCKIVKLFMVVLSYYDYGDLFYNDKNFQPSKEPINSCYGVPFATSTFISRGVDY